MYMERADTLFVGERRRRRFPSAMRSERSEPSNPTRRMPEQVKL